MVQDRAVQRGRVRGESLIAAVKAALRAEKAGGRRGVKGRAADLNERLEADRNAAASKKARVRQDASAHRPNGHRHGAPASGEARRIDHARGVVLQAEAGRSRPASRAADLHAGAGHQVAAQSGAVRGASREAGGHAPEARAREGSRAGKSPAASPGGKRPGPGGKSGGKRRD